MIFSGFSTVGAVKACRGLRSKQQLGVNLYISKVTIQMWKEDCVLFLLEVQIISIYKFNHDCITQPCQQAQFKWSKQT
jgi:hypothetical protein